MSKNDSSEQPKKSVSGGRSKTVRKEQPPPTDEKAEKEATNLATGRLQRAETTETHLHRLLLALFWTVAVSGVAMIAVWAFHMIAPDKCRFLSDARIDKIQGLLGTAVSSALFTDLVKRKIFPPENSN